MKHGTNCGCPDCEDFHDPTASGGTMSEPTPPNCPSCQHAYHVGHCNVSDGFTPAGCKCFAREVHEPEDERPEKLSQPIPPQLHEIAHKVCLAYGITYTGWPAELVDPAACEGSITWGLEQAFKLGRHVDDAFFKLQAAALRLRVEELTHERDQALDILWRDIDDLRDPKLSLPQVAAKAANGKYWSQVRKDWLQLRAEKAERELGEARQARWIPVSEKLPEPQTWVIGCMEHDGKQNVSPVYGRMVDVPARWRWESEFIVTHWMNLPETPCKG